MHNASETGRSAVIREVGLVIDAYSATLEFILKSLKAYTKNDMPGFARERENAYECLSRLLDGIEFESMDLADSFRQVHMDALRLVWSDEPKHWVTATRLLVRLRNGCSQSRVRAVEGSQKSSESASVC